MQSAFTYGGRHHIEFFSILIALKSAIQTLISILRDKVKQKK